MPEYFLMAQGHKFWDETIAFAERCSWRAGPFLAERMKENDFLPWERVCVTCVDEKTAGFCTFTQKDELPEEYGFEPFIGFVFVGEPYRGKRCSEGMIQTIIPYARGLGYKKLYVMSGEAGLYEKFGFAKLGEYRTVYNTTDQLFVRVIG